MSFYSFGFAVLALLLVGGWIDKGTFDPPWIAVAVAGYFLGRWAATWDTREEWK